jgi:hypothetical protein
MLMVNLITLKLKRMQQDTLLLICLLKIYKTGLHLKRNKSAAGDRAARISLLNNSMEEVKKVSSQAGTTRKI